MVTLNISWLVSLMNLRLMVTDLKYSLSFLAHGSGHRLLLRLILVTGA